MRDLSPPPAPDQRRPMRIPVSLVKGLSREEIDELVEKIRNCSDVRQRIAGVLTKELESATILGEKRENLESPNYVGVLADLAGYRRGLRHALALLTMKEQPE